MHVRLDKENTKKMKAITKKTERSVARETNIAVRQYSPNYDQRACVKGGGKPVKLPNGTVYWD